MKPNDIRKKNPTELSKMVAEMETELREFRFGMSGARTKNVRRARAIRKDIARIKTILTQKSHA
jgi:large subunit ribosomal protein L29